MIFIGIFLFLFGGWILYSVDQFGQNYLNQLFFKLSFSHDLWELISYILIFGGVILVLLGGY
jgi:hypothetical protein